MWELLGAALEKAFDMIGELFEEGGSGESSDIPGPPVEVDTAGDTGVADLPAEQSPAGPLDGMGATPGTEFPVSDGSSALASTDGGISSDRWDPQPPAGPFTP